MIKNNIKNVAILTSGGDAPGMNKVIYTCCNNLIKKNIKPFIILDGYLGLFQNKIKKANMIILENSANHSGSIIYSSRFDEHRNKDIIKKSVSNLKKNNIDVLIIIGGNGTFEGSKLLINSGIKVICIPATIDNDISNTEYSIGFDSALSSIVDTIDNLNNTATSHGKVFLIEAMGRDCSDLTLAAGLASRVDYIVTKHNKLSPDEYVSIIKKLSKKRRSIIFLITEKIYENDKFDLPFLKNYINLYTNKKAEFHIIGFIQRGAKPTAFERYNAARLGNFAVELILNNTFNVAIGVKGQKLIKNNILKTNFNKKRDTKDIINKINLINYTN